MFAVFLTVALLIIVLVIRIESTNKPWRVLSESYAIRWESHDWADNSPMHVWLSGDNKGTWINAMHILPSEGGLRFHPPWIKRWYVRSINVPWAALKLGSTSVGLRGKLVLEVPSLGIFLAIPDKYTGSIRLPDPPDSDAEVLHG